MFGVIVTTKQMSLLSLCPKYYLINYHVGDLLDGIFENMPIVQNSIQVKGIFRGKANFGVFINYKLELKTR